MAGRGFNVSFLHMFSAFFFFSSLVSLLNLKWLLWYFCLYNTTNYSKSVSQHFNGYGKQFFCFGWGEVIWTEIFLRTEDVFRNVAPELIELFLLPVAAEDTLLIQEPSLRCQQHWNCNQWDFRLILKLQVKTFQCCETDKQRDFRQAHSWLEN